MHLWVFLFANLSGLNNKKIEGTDNNKKHESYNACNGTRILSKCHTWLLHKSPSVGEDVKKLRFHPSRKGNAPSCWKKREIKKKSEKKKYKESYIKKRSYEKNERVKKKMSSFANTIKANTHHLHVCDLALVQTWVKIFKPPPRQVQYSNL